MSAVLVFFVSGHKTFDDDDDDDDEMSCAYFGTECLGSEVSWVRRVH